MMTKKTLNQLLLFVLLTTTSVNAQVSIGKDKVPENYSVLELISNGKNGFRLPQLSTDQRNTITLAGDTLADGLTIFNTTTGCTDYWNGKKWISLCTGSSEFVVSENTSNCKPFAADGLCKNSYAVEDPDCHGQGNFTLTWVSGEEFIDQLMIDQAGDSVRFTVEFHPNNRASSRNAVLMITSPCGSSNLLTFVQAGDYSKCADPATAPKILSENGTSLCKNGAVYLYLEGRPAGIYVWTLNGTEVEQGTEYVATQSGKYIVYANKIGCTNYKPDTLTLSLTASSTSPQPVPIIVGQNNGYVCNGGTTALYAQTPAIGVLAWYKNGQKQTVSQTPSGNYTAIQAGVGSWFTVVENGPCSSVKSNEFIIYEDATSGSTLAIPIVKVNGSSASSATVCSGSILLLEVDNAANYPPGTTFTWYVNNSVKGTGTRYDLNASQITTDFLLQCRASGTGCSSAGIVQVNVTVGNAPSTTKINFGQTTATICGNNPAILTAGASAGNGNYKWYLEGVEITGSVDAVHNTTTTGIYTVRYKNASGCWSALSDPISVVNNGAISLQWGIRPDAVDAIIGTSKTYSVIAAPTPDSYVWTSNNPSVATVTATGNGSSGGVDYLTTGEVKIIVSATNACGTVQLSSNALNVTTGCTPITSVTLSPSGTIRKNLDEHGNPKTSDDNNTLFTAAATNGSPATSYEWFVDGVLQQGQTSSTFTYTTPATVASYSIAVRAYNSCTGTPGNNDGALSGATTVVVKKDAPADISGNYRLTGKTCFDVKLGNNNATCIPLNSRTDDFASGLSFLYQFTYSASYSDLSFELDGDNPSLATVTQSGAIATLTFVNNIANLAAGKDKNNALKLKLIAKYKDNTNVLRQLELEMAVQDCSCGCSVKTINGEWLTFMCYNLGISEEAKSWSIAQQMSYNSTSDMDATIQGDLYQWGRIADGHEKRNSQSINGPITSFDDNGQATGNAVGKFIRVVSSPYDWRSPQNSSLWNKNKTVNDPCPSGWRVPTQQEWKSIFTENSFSITIGTSWVNLSSGNSIRWSDGNTKGLEISINEGNSTVLFLPAAGYRNLDETSIRSANFLGLYGSSTATTNFNKSYGMYFTNRVLLPSDDDNYRAYGTSIRCIAN